MPYKTRSELPDTVQKALRDVPHAQDIYKEAFNSAFSQYDTPEKREGDVSREEVAHAVAWSAVMKQYTKSATGVWRKK